MLTRRLLPVAIAAVLACLGLTCPGAVGAASAAPAAACPASRASFQEQVKQASAVFTGTVSGRRTSHRHVVYGVDVDRVYKGSVSGSTVSVTTKRSARACGLPDLEADGSYLFLADTGRGGRLSIARGGGTTPATATSVRRIERLLGNGRPATPPEPEQATFSQVAGAPTSFLRLAAPGAALVIVGVLGLMLVGFLGRRRA